MAAAGARHVARGRPPLPAGGAAPTCHRWGVDGADISSFPARCLHRLTPRIAADPRRQTGMAAWTRLLRHAAGSTLSGEPAGDTAPGRRHKRFAAGDPVGRARAL